MRFPVFTTLLCLAADWPDLNVPPPAAGPASTHDAAVIVGIEDYMVVSDVPGARQNADDWFRYLTKTRQIPVNQA